MNTSDRFVNESEETTAGRLLAIEQILARILFKLSLPQDNPDTGMAVDDIVSAPVREDSVEQTAEFFAGYAGSFERIRDFIEYNRRRFR